VTAEWIKQHPWTGVREERTTIPRQTGQNLSRRARWRRDRRSGDYVNPPAGEHTPPADDDEPVSQRRGVIAPSVRRPPRGPVDDCLSLRRALRMLRREPVAVEEAAAKLYETGLTSGVVHPSVILLAAEWFELEATATVMQMGTARRSLSRSTNADWSR
jgi:hypothetical protein